MTVQQNRNQSDVYQKVNQILSAIMPTYNLSHWQLSTGLYGVLPEFDSMAIVTLIGEIEDTFDIELDDDDVTAENFETVGSVIQLIIER